MRYLQLNFLDAAELGSGQELKVPPVVWKAEAASAGSVSDIRTVAPLMFREMLGEFPVKTSKDERRTVYCMEYGEIGIEIDRRDWRLIKAVEPGSPAALAGVTTADSLEKINDATMSWRMSYRPEKEKALAHIRLGQRASADRQLTRFLNGLDAYAGPRGLPRGVRRLAAGRRGPAGPFRRASVPGFDGSAASGPASLTSRPPPGPSNSGTGGAVSPARRLAPLVRDVPPRSFVRPAGAPR